MRNQKGITLIALVITIIVMLILVAVVLTIALGDNGILKKARDAKAQQAAQLEKEQDVFLGNTFENTVNSVVKGENAIISTALTEEKTMKKQGNIVFNVLYGSAYKNNKEQITDLKQKCINAGLTEEEYNLIDLNEDDYIPIYDSEDKTEEVKGVSVIFFENGKCLLISSGGSVEVDELTYKDDNAYTLSEVHFFKFGEGYGIILAN